MINVGNFSRIHFVRQKEFKNILTKILMCHELMCSDCIANKRTLPNNENQLRDILHYEYLNDKQVRIKVKLGEYLFIPEVPENEKQGDVRGRTDFRIILKSRTFENPQEYFTIECKRIDGNDSLNNAYIANGIKRFVNENPLYLSYYRTNGMLGFIVKDIDIDNNITAINDLLLNEHKAISTLNGLSCENSVPYCYKSLHTSQGHSLQLYHLMLDLSHLII